MGQIDFFSVSPDFEKMKIDEKVLTNEALIPAEQRLMLAIILQAIRDVKNNYEGFNIKKFKQWLISPDGQKILNLANIDHSYFLRKINF